MTYQEAVNLESGDTSALLFKLVEYFESHGYSVNTKKFWVDEYAGHDGRHKRIYMEKGEKPPTKPSGLAKASYISVVAKKETTSVRFNDFDKSIDLYYSTKPQSEGGSYRKVAGASIDTNKFFYERNLRSLLDKIDTINRTGSLKSAIFSTVDFDGDRFIHGIGVTTINNTISSASVKGIITIDDNGNIREVKDDPDADAWFLIEVQYRYVNRQPADIITDGSSWAPIQKNQIVSLDQSIPRLTLIDRDLIEEALARYVSKQNG